MSSSRRCAACKYLRRRCSEECVLSPYFPASDPHRFACVHRIFGASNVARMLQHLPVQQRADAAEAISSESRWRVQDPVYGSAGIITQLQQDIYMHQHELAQTQAQIEMYSTRTQTQTQTRTQIQTQQLDPVLPIVDGTFHDFSHLQNLLHLNQGQRRD